LYSGPSAASSFKVFLKGITPVTQVIETERSQVRVVQDGIGGPVGAGAEGRGGGRLQARQRRQIGDGEKFIT